MVRKVHYIATLVQDLGPYPDDWTDEQIVEHERKHADDYLIDALINGEIRPNVLIVNEEELE
jgi:hypothetical protein